MKKKAVTGIFFILSCFAAMFVLLEFHDNYLFVGIAALLLLVSSFCFLNAVFAEKSKEWGALEEQENGKGACGSNEEQFKKNVINYMETMNRNQAEILQELKSQKEVMTVQIKSLENEISSLSEKEMFQTKTVVKYNKENARQLALNEKKVVEQAVKELKEAMGEVAGRTVVASLAAATEEAKVPVVEDIVIPEVATEMPVTENIVVPEIPVELPVTVDVEIPQVVTDLPKVEDIVVPEIPVELPVTVDVEMPEVVTDLPKIEDIVVPEIPTELPMMEDLEILEAEIELPKVKEMEIPELPPMEDLDLPVLDDIVVEEEPLAPLAVDSDPNKIMTPDDIAKLLASMGM